MDKTTQNAQGPLGAAQSHSEQPVKKALQEGDVIWAVGIAHSLAAVHIAQRPLRTAHQKSTSGGQCDFFEAVHIAQRPLGTALQKSTSGR